MKKLLNHISAHALVAFATIAAFAAISAAPAQAGTYTIFGQDNPRGSLTNSTYASQLFQGNVFDESINTLDSLTAGQRNAIYTQNLPAIAGNRDIQYGLTFNVGGNTIYARSSRVTETYVTGLILTNTTAPQYDDGIYASGNNPRAGFNATSVSGNNLMGGSTLTQLHFDFATTNNTGNLTGINAFGFYGIDAGDTATNNMSVTVNYVDGTTGSFDIKPGGFTNGQSNDNVFFFGLVNTDKAFNGVTINNPQAATDAVAYDNFMIGRSANAVMVPEASTLVGAGLGFMMTGMVVLTRRKKTA